MANDYSRKPFCLEFGKSTASCIGRCSSPHLGPEHTVNMVCEIFKLEVKSKVKVIKLSGTILPLVVMEPNGQTLMSSGQKFLSGASVPYWRKTQINYYSLEYMEHRWQIRLRTLEFYRVFSGSKKLLTLKRKKFWHMLQEGGTLRTLCYVK